MACTSAADRQCGPPKSAHQGREDRLATIEAEGLADWLAAGVDARCEWPLFSVEFSAWRRGWLKGMTEERGA